MEWTSLVEVLRYRAARQAQRVAYGFLPDGEGDPVELTYAELDRRARCVAARLQALDAAGQRALLLCAPGLDYIAAFLGCLYAGVVAVPAYPPRNARALPRIKAIADDAGASLVLDGAQDPGPLQAMVAQLPQLQRLQWVATDGAAPGQAEHWQPLDIRGDTVAFLQYTSGSTGEPKGVVLTHANLLANAGIIARAFGTTADSVVMSWLPPYHDMGLIGGILQGLAVGFPAYLMAPALFLQRPLRWLRAITRVRATHSGGPNFAYDLCVQRIPAEQRAGLDLRSWAVAFNGAEPVRAATLAGFSDAFGACGFDRRSFLPCYGLAEATLLVSGGRGGPVQVSAGRQALEAGRFVICDAPDARQLVGCGPLATVPGTRVVDPATGRSCPDGQVGEIWVRNPSVSQGYWNRPEVNAQVFGARVADDPAPAAAHLRTGDLGFVHDGQLYVTGRLKDLIIVRGRNLYPTDVEAAVQACHPALRAHGGVAFGVEVQGQEHLVVAQELEFRHRGGDPSELEAACRAIVQAVAAQFEIVPHAVLLLKAGALPTTSSGKLRRREARQGFVQGTLAPLHEWRAAPARPAEAGSTPAAAPLVPAAVSLTELLVARVAAKAGIAPAEVNIDRPFTDYGLGSIEAVELSCELEQHLGRPLPPTLAWDHPSVRLLAAHLGGAPGSQAAPAPRPAAPHEPIALIGMACCFPGAPDLDAYWRLLADGIDAITTVPPDRWDTDAYFAAQPGTPGKLCSRWGGFVADIDAFDAELFDISAGEACGMDPQQRLLLQTAWQALEHAGQSPAGLAGSQAGVFIGISTNDYARRLAGQPLAMQAHTGTGNANSIAANRISYQFGLLGPSMAIDTACSSSLVAVHLACQSLRLGETDLALAGGVNLMLEPDLTIAFSQAGMLAADGRCKTFDARADGYVRGEGCGVVVLKRLSDAQRDGDPIVALLRGSAVNQNGRSNGLTAPSRAAQRAVIQRALAQAGVTPAQISYVEAHGTGTALGDPIEIQGLVEALSAEERAAPCAVGSVKTNIGHLEAAAGIAGLIKTALMLQHQELVAHLHIEKLNPRLRRSALPVFVPGERRAWTPMPGAARLAGVSSFGFGGANAHVVLEEAPVLPVPRPAADERPLHLLTLCAANEAALRELAQRYRRFLAGLEPRQVGNACFTANAGRSRLPQRLCVMGATALELAERLGEFAAGQQVGVPWQGRAPGSALWHGRVSAGATPPVALAFHDAPAGPIVGLGHSVSRSEPVFRAVLDRCDAWLQARGLQPSAASSLFALQLATARLHAQWGVVPAAVLGLGAGEWAAACHAGVFSLETGLQLLLTGDLAVPLQAPTVPLLLGSGGAPAAAQLLDPAYWRRPREAGHLRLAEVQAAAQGLGTKLILEAGPCGPQDRADAATHWLRGLQVGSPDWAVLLGQAAQLTVAGVAIDWPAFDRDHARRRIVLPHYPFQRQRFWAEAARRGPGRSASPAHATPIVSEP